WGISPPPDPRQDPANIHFHTQPLSLDAFGEPLHRFPAITASACNLRPTSRRCVNVRSRDIHDKPLIKPNKLPTPEDQNGPADATRTKRRLISHSAMARFRPVEHGPG